MIPGAIYNLPDAHGRGRGDVIQLHQDRRRDSDGHLYCYSSDPTRHRIHPSEEARLVLLDEAPAEGPVLWTWWRRVCCAPAVTP